jgi:riboflavin kinase/FMN adenylyltransferase
MLAVSIGNFDGVHLGHAALVREAREAADAKAENAGLERGRVVVVTFEPHPVSRLRPGAAPPRLTTSPERRRLLLAAGADEVVELDPSPALLAASPEEFTRTLRERMPWATIVEGDDFRFGHRRAGSVETLRQLGSAMGFSVREVRGVDVPLCDQTLVRASSSMVRWLLAHGRVRDAARLLGRPYELLSVTVPGDRRGRTIGFPTLNCGPVEQLMPADGVYGGVATLPGGGQALAAISIGTKPTFRQPGVPAPRTCEAYLLDTQLPLDWYGVSLRLSFVTWIREQRTYASLDALLERIRADVHDIRRRLAPASSPHVVGGQAMGATHE